MYEIQNIVSNCTDVEFLIINNKRITREVIIILFCTSVHFEILFSFTFTVNPTKDRTIPIIIHKLFSVRRYLY